MNVHSKGFRSIAAAAISAAFASSIATPCVATEESDVLQATVNYSDLDVTTPHGAKALYSRLQDAARSVCAPLNTADSFAAMRLHICVRRAIARAVIKVDVPAVSDVYQKRNGIPSQGDLVANQIR